MCERSSETRSTRLLMLSQSAAFQELSSFKKIKKIHTIFEQLIFRISPSEETVKRLNLDIDLQMLPTALHACCHSSHRGEMLSGRKKVCSYCCRFPLYISAGKLERAGQVLICMLKQEREYINDFTSERIKQWLAVAAGAFSISRLSGQSFLLNFFSH